MMLSICTRIARSKKSRFRDRTLEATLTGWKRSSCASKGAGAADSAAFCLLLLLPKPKSERLASACQVGSADAATAGCMANRPVPAGLRMPALLHIALATSLLLEDCSILYMESELLTWRGTALGEDERLAALSSANTDQIISYALVLSTNAQDAVYCTQILQKMCSQ